MTLMQAYSYSVKFLEYNNVDESDFKALCICCHLAGIKNSDYTFHKDDFVPNRKLADMLWKLKEGEPLQYVIGKWDFFESEFLVGEGVLIPRPETEELVELIVSQIGNDKKTVFDLCAGSGCIGLSIARACKNTTVTLFEKSEKAFEYLKKNAQNDENATPLLFDINNSFNKKADIIVSNPPYIKTDDIKTLQKEVKKEPFIALDGGFDGLDFYRVINDKWYKNINKNGALYLEIGENQGEDIKTVLTNFTDIEITKDIYGNDRIVKAVPKD